MKKITMKTAAFITAAVIAGTTCAPLTASADKNVAVSSSAVADAGMQTALTRVKQRVSIPAELSEFNYTTSKNYGTTLYRFVWSTPDGSGSRKSLSVSISGSIISEYSFRDTGRIYSKEPKLAKLSEEQLTEKAKGYVKQLDPDIYPDVRFELESLALRGDSASVRFSRYENGIPVKSNGGTVTLNKDTGELISMNIDWWENAVFSSAKSALSEKEIKAAYEKLCPLTPYYCISYSWDRETEKSLPKVNLIYRPDSDYTLDAFTGSKSTIWDDMAEAGGTKDLYNSYAESDCDDGAEEYEEEEAEAGAGVVFTPEELKKIEQNNKLIKTDKAFELLKKDKFVALTDSYILSSFDIYSSKDEKGRETFTMNLNYKVDESKKSSMKNYYSGINVTIDAETGGVKSFYKYGLTKSDSAPLDVKAANAVAEEAAKTYSKDIFSQYKASPENTKPVNVWYDSRNTVHYETSRTFRFNRYVNGIQVLGDRIWVQADSSGTVVSYSVNHTENITFPKADILSREKAFEKLYSQKKFDYYYDGWKDKDGKVHTYLIRRMESYTLNAKTGKLSGWDGSELAEYKALKDVEYTDIKGIPQEKAILTMKKYGVAVTTDSKFDPNKPITEDEFRKLLENTLSYAAAVYEDIEEIEDTGDGGKKKTAKNDTDKTTREEAAVIFAGFYDRDNISEISGIFKTPFSDVSASNPNIGRIAIAYGKGFMPKTADGKFNGSRTVTRAEAVQMIYDYLKVLSK